MLRTALIASAFALAACATETVDTAANTPAPDRDCFNADLVSGYSYVDEHHIAVNVGANRRYILSTGFNARELDWTQAIAIRSTNSWICTGNGLGVEIIGGERFVQRYPVNGVERAPDEAPGSDQGS